MRFAISITAPTIAIAKKAHDRHPVRFEQDQLPSGGSGGGARRMERPWLNGTVSRNANKTWDAGKGDSKLVQQLDQLAVDPLRLILVRAAPLGLRSTFHELPCLEPVSGRA
jgi:hypothetical protein